MTLDERIKKLSDKLCLSYLIRGMSHEQIYDFICGYFFKPNFNILDHTFEQMCEIVDESLGSYSQMLSQDDKREIYDLTIEMCKTCKMCKNKK